MGSKERDESLLQLLKHLPEYYATQDWLALGPDRIEDEPEELMPRPSEAAPQLTDLGNARRFATQHGHNVQYCAALGGWFVWTGRRWRLDDTDQVMRFVKGSADTLFDEAVEELDKAKAGMMWLRSNGESLGAEKAKEMKAKLDASVTRAKRRLAWALRTQSRPRLEAIVKLAESEPGIAVRADAFDRDAWLLNVQNGTVNLRTGELREHRRDDLLTKLAPVDYDPEARDAVFERYLTDTTAGDKQLAVYLQRAAGYSLTGVTHEEDVFLILGPGGSGKTTFVEAMLAAMGDYGHKASFATFLARRAGVGDGDPARSDIVDLRGKRLVAATEPEKGRRLAIAVVKESSGGDTLNARRAYAKHAVTFRPTHKLWLAANRAPLMDDDDSGLWRRLKRLPFEHVIPEEKQDPAIKKHLTTKGRVAVLAWAVQGCLAWQREGLRPPRRVSKATGELRAQCDPIAEFIDTYSIVQSGAEAPAADLRAAYEGWADEMGARPINNREWGQRLRALGCESVVKRQEGKQRTVWVGIGLRADDDGSSHQTLL